MVAVVFVAPYPYGAHRVRGVRLRDDKTLHRIRCKLPGEDWLQHRLYDAALERLPDGCPEGISNPGAAAGLLVRVDVDTFYKSTGRDLPVLYVQQLLFDRA
jgi:hypothetical protein